LKKNNNKEKEIERGDFIKEKYKDLGKNQNRMHELIV